jgi:hypothetical protein
MKAMGISSKGTISNMISRAEKAGMLTRRTPHTEMPLVFNAIAGTFTRGDKRADWDNCNGHRYVTLNGKHQSAHRVGWFMHYGSWPDGPVDHINGNGHDNRISNLRVCTQRQNCFNKFDGKNSTGHKGVYFNRQAGAWLVKVKAGATIVHKTASHSISAVVAARLLRRLLHGEFAVETSREASV